MFRTLLSALFLALISNSQAAQTLAFLSDKGTSTDVNEALRGVTIPDSLSGNDYYGYVGELILIPQDSGILAEATADTKGIATSDADGIFGGARGFVGFCIDSETPFLTSSSLGETFAYQPLSFEAANARFQTDSVDQYLNGGLKRAAYMIETFYDAASAGGDFEAGALQISIWGALYDIDPDVSTGSGNYYVRNTIGSPQTQSTSNDLINLVNGWYSQAAADDWGGPDYNPDENVVFWVDPDDATSNQSIITLRVDGTPVDFVPEPGVSLTLLSSLSMLMLIRCRGRL